MKKIKSPFLQKVSTAVQVKHYAESTRKIYVMWAKDFICFHVFKNSILYAHIHPKI